MVENSHILTNELSKNHTQDNLLKINSTKTTGDIPADIPDERQERAMNLNLSDSGPACSSLLASTTRQHLNGSAKIDVNAQKEAADAGELGSDKIQNQSPADGRSELSKSGLFGSSSDEEEEHQQQPIGDSAGNEQQVSSHSHAEKFPKHKALGWSPIHKISVGSEYIGLKSKVSRRDGRLEISLKETVNKGYLGKALNGSFKHHSGIPAHQLGGRCNQKHRGHAAAARPEQASAKVDKIPRPKLNIVVMVIGSRGDIQPFIKVGKLLKEQHGHRVRIATHGVFKEFVEKDCGLEFFNVGGNPAELMAFMVKNPGLIPNISTVKAGEIGRRRNDMYEMFNGFWRACVNATDDETDVANRKMIDQPPFVADAIIANPPGMAHIHCAERLGCPLHMMFTFPYTPTQQFPHPLARIKSSNVDANYTNFISYPLVDLLTWQGLGDLVNRFRVKTLGLDPVSTAWAIEHRYRLKVPYSYMWSPALVPKPPDWGAEIDIAGFVFLELASGFKPSDALTEFLDAGEAPIYIGFGSIVVDDAKKFTNLILAAVKLAGVRALISEGWGGLGGENIPHNVYVLGNTPHDWLFPRCQAVVHHGGAGTTAIGLKCARPTMIVPFFGDQHFWGAMVASAKAGAHDCIPYNKLTADKLAQGIKQCLTDEARKNVQKLADSMMREGDGAANAVKSFHANLPMSGENSMRCSILEDRPAVWQLRHSKLRLCPLAAEVLAEQKKLVFRDLKLRRVYDWNNFQGAIDPLTGATLAIARSIVELGKGVVEGPVLMEKDIEKRARYETNRIKYNKEVKRRQSMRGIAASEGKGVNGATMREEHVNRNLKDGADRQLPDRIQGSGDIASELRSKQYTNIRPSDPEHENTAASIDSAHPDVPAGNIGLDLAKDAAQGFAMSLGAIVKAPMELFYGLAQGFHNAPRLYGDSTVRRPIRIQGVRSGLRAAFTEFTFGTYDAVTGVITQPYKGAKERGAVGFVTGMGKGLGGLVLKECAAVLGPVASVMKGVQREVTKGSTPVALLKKARIVQGRREWEGLTEEDRMRTVEEVSRGWEGCDRGWGNREQDE